MVRLSLKGNRLNGTIPASWSLLPLLQSIDLNENNLSGTIPTPLPPELATLGLSHSHLTGALPPTLPSHLAIIKLSGNALSQALPPSWSLAENLTILALDNNNFSGGLPASWATWGLRTHNSLQMSIVDAGLHGKLPQSWVKQFCLRVMQLDKPQVVFRPKVQWVTFSLSGFHIGFTSNPVLSLVLDPQYVRINNTGWQADLLFLY